MNQSPMSVQNSQVVLNASPSTHGNLPQTNVISKLFLQNYFFFIKLFYLCS